MIKFITVILYIVLINSFGQAQMIQNLNNVEKMKVIYVFDPICGWCYGFSEVMMEFYQRNIDKYNFQVISGGMMTGNRVGSINDVAPFIKSGYKRVEEATGITFGQAYLEKMHIGDFILNSLPPSIALVVFEEQMPNRTIEFAKELQKAIYFDGIEPEDIEALAGYAVKLGYSTQAEFLKKMKDSKYSIAAQNHFDRARALNVTSYPTILIEKDGVYRIVSSGYVSYDELERNILQALR